jgi:hypothetical protein
VNGCYNRAASIFQTLGVRSGGGDEEKEDRALIVPQLSSLADTAALHPFLLPPQQSEPLPQAVRQVPLSQEPPSPGHLRKSSVCQLGTLGVTFNRSPWFSRGGDWREAPGPVPEAVKGRSQEIGSSMVLGDGPHRPQQEEVGWGYKA